MLMAFLRLALILSRERPYALISTGSEIAIPAFILGKLLRIRLVFVESLCRITKPSGTGLLVYPLSDAFYVQWPQLRHRYGRKARYEGAVI